MHYFVLVLVPPERRDLQEAVTELLAPFDEALEVEPYEVECYCIGREAEEDAHAVATRQFGTTYEIRQRLDEENAEKLAHLKKLREPIRAFQEVSDEVISEIQVLQNEQDRLWEEAKAPYFAAFEESLKRHPLKDKPDPNCEECGGTGRSVSTENPQGEWDYWGFGNRHARRYDEYYDPEKDTENIVTCSVCNGTGDRPDKAFFFLKGKMVNEVKCQPNSTEGNKLQTEFPTGHWRELVMLSRRGLQMSGCGTITDIKKKENIFVPAGARFKPWCDVCKGRGKALWWLMQGDLDSNLLEGAVFPVSAIVKAGVVLHAVVTPDGKWHEEESLAKWVDAFHNLMKANQHCLAVACDIYW
jgi:hypothetical protein